MSAWAEHIVGGIKFAYPPREGEKCSGCPHVFVEDERAFRLTDRDDNEHFCGKCAGEPDPAGEPMGG